MGWRQLRWGVVVVIVALAWLVYAHRYRIEARIWHLQYGDSTRVGNYEVPVPDGWLVSSRDSTGLLMINTNAAKSEDGSSLHGFVINMSSGSAPRDLERLEFWLTYRRQQLESEGAGGVQEKHLYLNGETVLCIGSSDYRGVRGKGSINTNLISIDCASDQSLYLLLFGAPPDAQSFYAFVSQIHK